MNSVKIIIRKSIFDLAICSANTLNAGYQILHFFCLLLIIFHLIKIFKQLRNINSIFQTVQIQNRPEILSVLIWVQTVCQGYFSSLAGKELNCPIESNWVGIGQGKHNFLSIKM